MREVATHCCWGMSAARELTIDSIESRCATHYVLESFAEKRSTKWYTEPYARGQPVDGPMNGPAPTPWEIDVQPPPPFMDTSVDLEVPHTATIKVGVAFQRASCAFA